jgi:superfamily II DNA or RNA helicase
MAEEFIDGIKVEIISSRTITKFDPVPDVLIISYSKLSAWAEDLRTLVKSMILDEIQEMRRYESEKTRAANSLRRHLKFCLGLSATPIYNYGGEIYNIINLIAPKVLGTQDEFHREWCDGYGDKCCLRDPDAFGAYLREQFLMVRRTRAEVGRELPPKMSLVQRIDYDPKVLDAVQDATFQLAKMVLEGGFHESGMAARELDAKARQATGVAKAPFVITFCRLLLDEGPIILTGWHREVYEIWKYQLDLHSIPYCMYTGSETAKEKDTAKKAFISGKAKLMILSLRSGEGLDGLQTASSTIVHGELDWSPGVMEQCSGRLFRDGQVKNVTEIFLVSDGGSDPVLSGMLGLKKVQLTGILEPGQEKGLKKLQVDANRIKKLAQYYVDNRFGGKGADPDASDDEPIQSPSDSALTAISSQTKHPITENK